MNTDRLIPPPFTFRVDMKDPDILALARKVVLKQAEDPALWFDAVHAPEAYLQEALRRLHHVIETGQEPESSSPKTS